MRRLEEKDLARFQAYRTDAEVARYQGWGQMSDSAAMSFIQHQHNAVFLEPGNWFQLGIADHLADNLIGDIGICVDAEEN